MVMHTRLLALAAAVLACTSVMAQQAGERQRQEWRNRQNRERQELEKMDVSVPKTAYLVSDAHLDTQWNWDIQTTIRDYIPKTIRQNLHLLRTYPNYIMNFEGAIKYGWMKEYFPNEYEEVKKYIAQGRWHLTGTSWDATETVISSSESLFRNTLLGQQFYRNEYGKESCDFFLPDCFGFPYNYPTIAQHCGVIGFSSQKLQWRTNKFYDQKLTKYPFSLGIWEGIDGSRIMMAHGYAYNHSFRDTDISEDRRLYREMSESPTGIGYRYYGTGDTGGSPNIPSVRAMEKGLKGNGPVKIISATSDQIYKDFLPYEKHPELPSFKGELYMDVHGVGCYTSQAAMKLYNRQNEHLADAAERSSVIAEWLGKREYPANDIRECWQTVILHQFHDDLTGTSIPRAYEFSWNDEIIDMKRFSDITFSAVSGISELMNTQVSGTPIVLYNPEGFTQNTVADVMLGAAMADSYTVTDAKGKKAASQVVTDTKGRKHLLINATVPATGFAVYSIKAAGKQAATAEKEVKTLENSVYKLTFDQNGNLSSIVDKRYSKEIVEQGKAIGLIVFTECESHAWPAWEILKKTVDGNKVTVNEDVSVKLVENGQLRKTVKVTKRYGESEISQYVSLYEGALADRIDFYNEVEWKSLNSLLKCTFPLSISNPMATYDLGLGSVERCNNEDFKYEVYSHEWTDLTDRSGDYGLTIINNCKYGWDKPADNELRLSLLWSPEVGRGYAYQNKQDFGHHEFTYSIIGHKGALDKGLAVEQSTMLNSPLRAFEATKHGGELGREFSFVASDNKNVTIRAFKKAEASNEYVIRVYENSGTAQQAKLTFAAPVLKAAEADGTEKTLGAASFSGKDLNVDIKGYGVKTYKLTFGNQRSMAEIPQAEIPLRWNKRCFSFNEFRNGADFDGGYSYAAELLPKDGLKVEGIHFGFQDMDGQNGYACWGDTITLPEGKYNKVFFLAAAAKDDAEGYVYFVVPGKKGNTVDSVAVNVPYYTGFVGQWGHDGQCEGFMKDGQIAYVGTHRHSSEGDEPYEFTYMYKIDVDIPKGATQIIMPRQPNIVIFAAKVADAPSQLKVASQMFVTGNKSNTVSKEKAVRANLLKEAKIIAKTGEVNERESAEKMTDGDIRTKWCDTKEAPNYVAFDLGSEKTISGWRLLNAGSEGGGYITRSCMLQVRSSLTSEWETVDLLDGNKQNDVIRSIEPVKAQYVRLYITSPTQRVGKDACRIYEFEVYE